MISLNEKINSGEFFPEREISEEARGADKGIATNLNELEFQLTRRYGVRIDEKIRDAINNLNVLAKEYRNRIKLYLDDITGPIEDIAKWYMKYNKTPPRLAPLYFTNLFYEPLQ